MRTIVFIETSKSGLSREALKAAERLGYFTVLFTNKQKFIDERTEFPDVHQMILVNSFDNDELKAKIINLQKQGKEIKGIMSFVDSFVHVAAALSEEFSHIDITLDPILEIENEILTHELLKASPIHQKNSKDRMTKFMQTIVFVETSKSGSSREALKAAERLGYFTVLLTNKQKFIDERTNFPDIHQMILVNSFDYDELKEKIINLQKQGKEIKGIMSFIDSLVHVAAALSEEFCHSVVSVDPILKMENKILTRELLKDLPMSPYYAIYTADQSLEEFIHKQKSYLPLIVKSPLSAGSKDVRLVKDKNQLKKAMQVLLQKNEQILLEEYLSGPQYLIEALVHNGKVHIVAIIEQEITYFNRFIVTGYSLLADMDEGEYDKILKTVSSILKTFQIKNGACHLEMRLVQGSWKLIEINPRISGGAMNRIIEVGYGINLVEETIQLILGNEPCLTKKHNKFVYAHYLTVNTEGILVNVTGRNRSSQYHGIEEVYIKPRKGQILRRPLSMGDRCGYILASSDDKEEAKRIAREAASEIRFHLI